MSGNATNLPPSQYPSGPLYKSEGIGYLLCVFLGWIGAHQFYLGNVKRGLTFVGLQVASFIFMLIAIILIFIESGRRILNEILVGNALPVFVNRSKVYEVEPHDEGRNKRLFPVQPI